MAKHLMGYFVHPVKTIWYVLAKPFILSWYVLSKNCLFRPPRTMLIKYNYLNDALFLRTSRFQV